MKVGRTHEFTRLTIINQKVLVLGAEAENCIGEDLSFVGATQNRCRDRSKYSPGRSHPAPGTHCQYRAPSSGQPERLTSTPVSFAICE